ncbi:Xaa-Pro dipeptidyl-peptidase OS=Streptomyces griseomycini OX=66895 GN=FHS37_005925 PE=3 SV=1 [Streptomyces griseomycini]
MPEGHRLALIVAGTDRGLIDPPADTPTLTLDLARTSARVPFVGGTAAFARATAGSHAEARDAVLDGVDRPSATAHRVPGEAR